VVGVVTGPTLSAGAIAASPTVAAAPIAKTAAMRLPCPTPTVVPRRAQRKTFDGGSGDAEERQKKRQAACRVSSVRRRAPRHR
jgi:hypothetical protein